MDHDGFDVGIANPSGSRFSRVVGGIIVPLGLAIWGMIAIVTQRAWLRGNNMLWSGGGGGGRLQIVGLDAILFGVGLIAFGLVVHVHFRWYFSERLCRWADPVKALGLLAGAGAFLVMIVRVTLWG